MTDVNTGEMLIDVYEVTLDQPSTGLISYVVPAREGVWGCV